MTDENIAPDPLDELRTRIREAQDAAERLHRQASDAQDADAAGHTPPRGWATPDDRRVRADEVHALAQLMGTLRELVPAELQAQVTDLIRLLLLLARAIIDWWVERLELVPGDAASDAAPHRAGPPPPRVEDIPIG